MVLPPLTKNGTPQPIQESSTNGLKVLPPLTKSSPIIKPPIQPTPTAVPKIQTVQPQRQNLLQQVQNVVKKIADYTFTFTKPKIVSPIPIGTAITPAQPSKPTVSKPITLQQGQKSLTATQLLQVQPNIQAGSSAQMTTQAKKVAQTRGVKDIVKSVNEALGPILGTIYVPAEYNPGLLGKMPKKLTAGKIIGGTIEDVLNATVPISGGAGIQLGRNIIKEGPNILSAFKTGALFSATTAAINILKGEGITMKDLLVNGGIGALIGMGEPTIQVGTTKVDLLDAKKTLNDYGFNASDFKNPNILKTKFRNVVKTIHPDKGGSTQDYVQFTDAFNKVTSAAVDKGWSFPDVTEWIKNIWNRKTAQPSEGTIVKVTENVKTNLGNLIINNNKTILGTGEKTPQEIINHVISTGQEKTSEGKAMLQAATQAQEAGQNIMIEKTQPIFTEKSVISQTNPPLSPTKEISVTQPQQGVQEQSRGVVQEKIIPKSLVQEKAQSRVFQRLQQEHPEQLKGELPYDKAVLKTEFDKAAGRIAKNKQEAYEIAMGRREATDLETVTTNIEMAEKALVENNNELYEKLVRNRSIGQTRRGQAIVAEKASIEDNSTARYVKDLLSARLDNLGKRYLSGLKDGQTIKKRAIEIMDGKVEALEVKIKRGKLDVKTALKLLDELTCIT